MTETGVVFRAWCLKLVRVGVEATGMATGAEIAPRRPHAYPTSAGGASHGWRGAFRVTGCRYGDR